MNNKPNQTATSGTGETVNMRVHKRRRTSKKTGLIIESTNYYLEFKDHDNITRTLTGFGHKDATVEAGRKLEKLIDLARFDEPPTGELARFIEQMPEKWREKLASWGVISKSKVAAGMGFTPLIADFRKHLEAKGNTEKHVEETCTMVKTVFDGCGFRRPSEIAPEPVRQYLHKRREDAENGISARRSNGLLVACKSFCRWLEVEGCLSENPLKHISRLNEKADRRHVRRAMLPDEARLLLSVTRLRPLADRGRKVVTLEGEKRSNWTYEPLTIANM